MKNRMVSSYELLFRCLVLGTFIILFLNITVDFPYISVLRKIKYVYLVVLGFRLFRHHEIKTTRALIVIVALIFTHTLLFGLLFVNSEVLSEIHTHCREMLLFILMFSLTANDVFHNNWFIRFLKYLFIASVVFVLWNAVRYFGDFVNPAYYIYAFSNTARIRAQFGMMEYNGAGNAFLMCMIISIISFIAVLQTQKRSRIVVVQLACILATLLVEFCMLFSTGSRTSIIGAFIFIFLIAAQYGAEKIRHILHLRNFQIAAFVSMLIVIIIALGYQTGMLAYIIEHSQRTDNWTVNFEIFKKINVWKLGMGYIEPAGFLNKIYGYDTYACDSFYFYIFFTTGIVGSVLMGSALIAILFGVLHSYRRYDIWSKVILSLFIMMLFAGLSEVNVVTYRFFSSTIYLIFIFYYLLQNSRKKIIVSI